MKSKNSVLITGGLGFIGSHLVNRLLGDNSISKIFILDLALSWHLSSSVITNSNKIEILHHDIRDQNFILEYASRCSTIYHLAAESHVQNSINNPKKFVDTNIMGTFSILEAVRKYGNRIIFASTSEVYGSVADDQISESHSLEPYSPYAATKIAADRLVAAYIRTYGIDATVVRMFNAFGQGQYFEKLIPMFICSSICDLPLPIQGDGNATRDWTYVEDVCSRLAQLLPSSSPNLCNLGSGTTRSVISIANDIALLSGHTHPFIEKYPSRAGSVDSQSANVEVVLNQFGTTNTSFENGLEKTFYWYKKNYSEWNRLFLKERPKIIADLK